MIGKILLTLAVIAIAYLYVRQRQIADDNEKPKSKANSAAQNARDELSKDLRTGAYMFLILMVGIGATLFYFDWRDDHSILTVNLHRNNGDQPVSYRVYKYQLQDRSFTTIDGVQITVASSERMEVLGLDE